MDRKEIQELAVSVFSQGVRAGVDCFHRTLYKTLKVGHVIPKEGDYILSEMGEFVYKQIKKHRPKESNQLKENLADAFDLGTKKGIDLYIDLLKLEINSKGHMCHECLVNAKPRIDKAVEEIAKLICIEVVTRH